MFKWILLLIISLLPSKLFLSLKISLMTNFICFWQFWQPMPIPLPPLRTILSNRKISIQVDILQQYIKWHLFAETRSLQIVVRSQQAVFSLSSSTSRRKARVSNLLNYWRCLENQRCSLGTVSILQVPSKVYIMALTSSSAVIERYELCQNYFLTCRSFCIFFSFSLLLSSIAFLLLSSPLSCSYIS